MNKLGKVVMTLASLIITFTIVFASGSVVKFLSDNGLLKNFNITNIFDKQEEKQEGIEIPKTGGSSGEVSPDPVLSLLSEDAKLAAILDETKGGEGFCLTNYSQKYDLSLEKMQNLYQEACVTIRAVDPNRPIGDSTFHQGSGVAIAGAGFVCDDETVIENGTYIVTNQHVTHPDNKSGFDLSVYAYDKNYDNDLNNDGIPDNSFAPFASAAYEATLLWSDFNLDMSIIYIEENIDWIKVKDRAIDCVSAEKIYDTEDVFVIGSPVYSGIAQHNIITTGSISGNNLGTAFTEIKAGVYQGKLSNVYEYLIPIKVPILPGNSGGGLFDEKGYLIGQPTLGSDDSNNSNTVNYAIPAYSAKLILDNLITKHEGVLDDIDNNLIQQNQYAAKVDNIDIYNLADFEIYGFDKKEFEHKSRAMITANQYLLNGKTYTNEVFSYNSINEMVKVLSSSQTGIVQGDFITHIQVTGYEKTEVSCRNDLIFELLKLREGENVKFYLKDKDLQNKTAVVLTAA